MRFIKGFSITGVTGVLLLVTAFFNNVVVTRQLGPEGRGKYTIITYLVMFIVLIFGEGIRRSNTILIGRSRSIENRLFYQTIFYAVTVAIILFMLNYFIPLWDKLFPNLSDQLFILTIFISVFTLLWQAFQAIFLGLEKIYKYNIIQLIAIILVFILNLIGIYFFDYQLEDIITNQLIAGAVAFLFGAININKKRPENSSGLFSVFNSERNELMLRSTVTALFIFIILRSNIFLVNYFLTPAEVGIFSVALIFFEMLQKLPIIAGPLIISKTVSDESDQPAITTARLSRVIFTINLFVTIVLVIFGKTIIIFLFKSQFSDSYAPLLLLTPALIIYGSGSVINAYYMGKAYPSFVIINSSIAGFLNLLLNFIFIPEYGILGAAVVSAITYSGWAIAYFIFFSRNSKIPLIDLILLNMDDINYFRSLVKGLLNRQ